MDRFGSGHLEVDDHDHGAVEVGVGFHAIPILEIRQDHQPVKAVEQTGVGRQEEEKGAVDGVAGAVQGLEEEAGS